MAYNGLNSRWKSFPISIYLAIPCHVHLPCHVHCRQRIPPILPVMLPAHRSLARTVTMPQLPLPCLNQCLYLFQHQLLRWTRYLLLHALSPGTYSPCFCTGDSHCHQNRRIAAFICSRVSVADPDSFDSDSTFHYNTGCGSGSFCVKIKSSVKSHRYRYITGAGTDAVFSNRYRLRSSLSGKGPKNKFKDLNYVRSGSTLEVSDLNPIN